MKVEISKQKQGGFIIGVGTDVVQISRIEQLYEKFGERFLYKNYHQLEINRFHELEQGSKYSFLAKRFAAKEAISKAFGLGIGPKMNFKDIAILNNSSGAPVAKIFTKLIDNLDDYSIHVSLSDDYPIALAFAVVTK